MNEAMIERLDWNKGNGLMPAVVQHADSGAVLMVGFQNAEALRQTLRRKRVVFWSRTKRRLWEKGETSGNFLNVIAVTSDCDADALLIRVRPAGPVCHTGEAACFTDAEPALAAIAALEEIVHRRANPNADESYTARLFAQGIRRIAQKLGEEGVETALAGAVGDERDLREEAADLVYHLIVLLCARGLRLADVAGALASRRK